MHFQNEIHCLQSIFQSLCQCAQSWRFLKPSGQFFELFKELVAFVCEHQHGQITKTSNLEGSDQDTLLATE